VVRPRRPASSSAAGPPRPHGWPPASGTRRHWQRRRTLRWFGPRLVWLCEKHLCLSNSSNNGNDNDVISTIQRREAVWGIAKTECKQQCNNNTNFYLRTGSTLFIRVQFSLSLVPFSWVYRSEPMLIMRSMSKLWLVAWHKNSRDLLHV
jgi:hypothetical protein